MLLFLFKPWRDEAELIRGHASYENAFKFYSQTNEINILLSTQFERQRQTILDAKEFCDKILNEEMEGDLFDAMNVANDAESEDNIYNEINTIALDLNCNSSIVDESKLHRSSKA